MYTKDYIQASYEVICNARDSDKILNSLHSYLSRRGLLQLYPAILRGLNEKLQRANIHAMPTVTVARNSDLKKFEKDIENFLSEKKADEKPNVYVDPHIIGGFIIKSSDKRIDYSYKKVLLHIYQQLTD